MGSQISSWMPRDSPDSSDTSNGDEPKSRPGSQEERFEIESEHLIVKYLGHGSYAQVCASIGDFDADIFAIDYDQANGDPVKQKAVFDKMRASKSAAKIFRTELYEEGCHDQIQGEIHTLRYLHDQYLEHKQADLGSSGQWPA